MPFNSSKFGVYELVEPVEVGPERPVPDHIDKPLYYFPGGRAEPPQQPEIKDADTIKRMRDSCRLAAEILRKCGELVEPGISTDELDKFAHNEIIKANAYPSPLRYEGFPKSICTSVNNVACHGIPDVRKLVDGDIINVDITVYTGKVHGDCSKTFLVGDSVDDKGKELVRVAEECRDLGIDVCGPGVELTRIGAVIEEHARKHGFTVAPTFCGHGIGSYFHGPPDIYHGRNSFGGIMETGMTFTIEPVITMGTKDMAILEDNWTIVSVDNARSAQFEHTILITENGHEILTVE